MLQPVAFRNRSKQPQCSAHLQVSIALEPECPPEGGRYMTVPPSARSVANPACDRTAGATLASIRDEPAIIPARTGPHMAGKIPALQKHARQQNSKTATIFSRAPFGNSPELRRTRPPRLRSKVSCAAKPIRAREQSCLPHSAPPLAHSPRRGQIQQPAQHAKLNRHRRRFIRLAHRPYSARRSAIRDPSAPLRPDDPQSPAPPPAASTCRNTAASSALSTESK